MNRFARKKTLFRAIALIVAPLALVLAFTTAVQLFKAAELNRANARLSLYHTTLTDALDRYRHLPFVLANDAFVQRGASGFGLPVLNTRLAALAKRTDLEAIYLMDISGRTIAASNHANPQTFLGNDYSFRPYFQAGFAGRSGDFFAIGVTTQRPGYFLSEPVRNTGGDVIAVIAIKVDMSALSALWAAGGETLFVSNNDGVVVLSSNASWQYSMLTSISAARLRDIRAERQFAEQALPRLAWQDRGNHQAKLGNSLYLHVTQALPAQRWTLHFLTPLSRIWARALAFVGALSGGALVMTAIGLYWRSRRIRLALQTSQAERRVLRSANAALEHEISVRRAAEARADAAQKELSRTSKLAALGHLAASVTHELGQPISAMKNHLAAAEFAAGDPEKRLITRMSGLVARMESVTRELRFFARPGEPNFEPVRMSRVVLGARDLVAGDLTTHSITLHITALDDSLHVKGNRLRLEQVLVNLLKNAMAAVKDSGERSIDLSLCQKQDQAVLSVVDHGPGLEGRSMDELQEPFHSTRASGEGMGLGLSISAAIVREHDGRLTAENWTGGAVFHLYLPLMLDTSHTEK